MLNIGVFVNEVTGGGKDEFYDVIKHIYGLVYNYIDMENKGLLLYYD